MATQAGGFPFDAPHAGRAGRRNGALRLGGVFNAEIQKLASLPAIWIGVAVTVLGSTAITVMNAMTVRNAVNAGDLQRLADTSPFETGFAAAPIIGVVGAVIIGVLGIGSEYTTDRAEAGGARQISTTLAAVPSRTILFTAKAATVLVITLLTALLTIPGNLGLAWAMTGDVGVETVSHDEAIARSLGAALYWVLMGLISFSITALARNGAIPLVVLIANSSVVSFSLLLAGLTPLAHWLPDMAGRNLFGFSPEYAMPGGLAAVPGALVMAAWTLGLLLIAATVFRRRDA